MISFKEIILINLLFMCFTYSCDYNSNLKRSINTPIEYNKYDIDGDILIKGYYYNEQPWGRWSYFNPTGELMLLIEYELVDDSNTFISQKKYYSKNRLIAIEEFEFAQNIIYLESDTNIIKRIKMGELWFKEYCSDCHYAAQQILIGQPLNVIFQDLTVQEVLKIVNDDIIGNSDGTLTHNVIPIEMTLDDIKKIKRFIKEYSKPVAD